MNRDIITADINWKEDTTPFIDLKVEIDDDDFSRNIYIEDIKLYNQDSFVNPTNASGGISIFGDVLYGDKKVDKFERVDNDIDGLFKPDTETPQTIIDHYKKVGDDYIPLEEGDLGQVTSYSFNNLNDNNNTKYYYYNSSYTTYQNKYLAVDYNNRKKEYFYVETIKTKIYDFKDLQNDSSFAQNFDINNDIIIISVKIHPNPNDKCQSDYILKAVYNKRLLLLESMAGVREINDTCTIPRRFIDFILRQKAIDLAQENNDVDLLCKYFRLFSGSIATNNIEFAPCGCLRG